MQRRPPSPNTQSGVSVKSRAVMYVLSKQCFLFTRVFHDSRTQKKSYRLATVEKPPWCGVRESRLCAACFGNKTAGRERRCFCRERGGPAARARVRVLYEAAIETCRPVRVLYNTKTVGGRSAEAVGRGGSSELFR